MRVLHVSAGSLTKFDQFYFSYSRIIIINDVQIDGAYMQFFLISLL